MKAFLLACCGCGRYLNTDGSMGSVALRGGLLLPNSPTEATASFDTVTEADEAASAVGWSVEDSDGPNHRCPDCQPKTTPQRGAYIRSELVML